MGGDGDFDARAREAEAPTEPSGLPAVAKLPALIPVVSVRRGKGRWRSRLLLLLLIVAGSLGGVNWWLQSRPTLPAGIAWGNGRLEADEVDIDTKFAGRILKRYANEGDLVKAGQVVAVMDTRDLHAQERQYEQVVREAQHTLDQAKANYANQQAVVNFDQQEVARSSHLVPLGYATQETLDQQRQALASATAALNADAAAIAAAEHAVAAAIHQVQYYKVNIADNTLIAPNNGPIEYRVANVGEVLPAGGKVFTMLDASYVYMDIYLPTEEAGRVRLGSDARIVLDAYSGHVIPAHVVFVASQAQFTPKTVETKQERDKLMFRIRVRIDPERLKGHEAIVRSGLPGQAYVLTNPSAVWPKSLQPSMPPSAGAANPG
jgi:HlyD family secretion protein